jgi:hypothetical protein
VKDDGRRRGSTDDVREPAQVGRAPGRPARGGLQSAAGIFTCPGEITQSGIGHLRDIDRGEIPRSNLNGPLGAQAMHHSLPLVAGPAATVKQGIPRADDGWKKPRLQIRSRVASGPAQPRREVVAGAWAYRYPATGRRHLPRRLEQRPQPIQDLRWKAPVRRCTRYRQRLARGKHANHVVVAIARAGLALRWAMARDIPLPASTP